MHTPGPWKWWTSNSWRRLKADHGRETPDILMPCVHKDGQADITASADDMGLIAAAPEMLEALLLASAIVSDERVLKRIDAAIKSARTPAQP